MFTYSDRQWQFQTSAPNLHGEVGIFLLLVLKSMSESILFCEIKDGWFESEFYSYTGERFVKLPEKGTVNNAV